MSFDEGAFGVFVLVGRAPETTLCRGSQSLTNKVMRARTK